MFRVNAKLHPKFLHDGSSTAEGRAKAPATSDEIEQGLERNLQVRQHQRRRQPGESSYAGIYGSLDAYLSILDSLRP